MQKLAFEQFVASKYFQFFSEIDFSKQEVKTYFECFDSSWPYSNKKVQKVKHCTLRFASQVFHCNNKLAKVAKKNGFLENFSRCLEFKTRLDIDINHSTYLHMRQFVRNL